jgi:hypothetical protein
MRVIARIKVVGLKRLRAIAYRRSCCRFGAFEELTGGSFEAKVPYYREAAREVASPVSPCLGSTSVMGMYRQLA